MPRQRKAAPVTITRADGSREVRSQAAIRAKRKVIAHGSGWRAERKRRRVREAKTLQVSIERDLAKQRERETTSAKLRRLREEALARLPPSSS